MTQLGLRGGDSAFADPSQSMSIPKAKFVWWRALWAAFNTSNERNLGLISAGVAFFGLLSIFPGLAALIALWGIFADPSFIDTQMELMRGIVPRDVFMLVDTQMDRLMSTTSGTLGFATALSLFLSLWSARAGVGAMIVGLNAIHGLPNRSGLWHYLLSFGLTIALVGVAIVATAAVVIAPIVLSFLPLDSWSEWIAALVRWAAAIFVLVMGLGVLHRYGPNHKPGKNAWVTPGLFVAVVLWAAASMGFSTYLSNFGQYNEIYGSIGAVAALLMWLYISAYLILLGAALNAELENWSDAP